MNFENKQLENRQLSKKEKEQLERDIKKYPQFLEAYLNKLKKAREEYQDAEFYILN